MAKFSAVALLFLSTALVSTATGAPPAALSCGTTITSDTTLAADVGPCNSGDGLIVQGSNFQLNLNGHRVFSDAPLPRNVGVDQDGVWIPADVVGIKLLNATGVTVRKGTVEGFNAGVSIENGGSNVVQGVTAQNNQAPCIGEDFSSFAVGQYGDGIVVFGSPDNRLQNNTIRNNGPFSGIALVANNTFITRAVPPYPSGNIIKGNLVEDNNICFADIGIRLEGPGASNTEVTNNTVRGSFQEGIVVHPVNVIDFRPLFQSPPACQNRGFPRPTLPQCPIQNPLNPTNDNNLIKNNLVSGNGFGGASINAGPNDPNNPSPQTASGINLLSFCGYGARSNATGNVVEGNTSTLNAGDGINVGGCPLGQNPANGTFPGFTNTQILHNTSVNNNGARCGTLAPTPGCGSRSTNPRVDLRDSTNQITCPSTSASTQAMCATLGFSPPPAPPTPFVGTPVVQPGGTACGDNTWFGNKYGTAFPSCTTAGGKQIDSAPPGKVRAAVGTTESEANEGPRPLRGRKQP
ncbi:MAG: right-handed parallel beta-helix repeat-containing protein [Acidimicrobiales bacterium]